MLNANLSLLERLLKASCIQAEMLLGDYDVTSSALERLKSDLELSPLLDKQLTAAALQVAMDRHLTSDIVASVLVRFRAPFPGVATDAQRRAVEAEVKQRGLPMELASDFSRTLEGRLAIDVHELPTLLWDYASLYGELWSDPRIGARLPTRRIMLAMATTLRARSAQLVAARTSVNRVRHSAAHDVPAAPTQGATS
jgi:hypothetical protein